MPIRFPKKLGHFCEASILSLAQNLALTEQSEGDIRLNSSSRIITFDSSELITECRRGLSLRENTEESKRQEKEIRLKIK